MGRARRGGWGFVEGGRELVKWDGDAAAARGPREWLLLWRLLGGQTTICRVVECESQWWGDEWADGVRPQFPREVKACGVFDDSLGAVEVVLVEREVGVLGVV